MDNTQKSTHEALGSAIDRVMLDPPKSLQEHAARLQKIQELLLGTTPSAAFQDRPLTDKINAFFTAYKGMDTVADWVSKKDPEILTNVFSNYVQYVSKISSSKMAGALAALDQQLSASPFAADFHQGALLAQEKSAEEFNKSIKCTAPNNLLSTLDELYQTPSPSEDLIEQLRSDLQAMSDAPNSVSSLVNGINFESLTLADESAFRLIEDLQDRLNTSLKGNPVAITYANISEVTALSEASISDPQDLEVNQQIYEQLFQSQIASKLATEKAMKDEPVEIHTEGDIKAFKESEGISTTRPKVNPSTPETLTGIYDESSTIARPKFTGNLDMDDRLSDDFSDRSLTDRESSDMPVPSVVAVPIDGLEQKVSRKTVVISDTKEVRSIGVHPEDRKDLESQIGILEQRKVEVASAIKTVGRESLYAIQHSMSAEKAVLTAQRKLKTAEQAFNDSPDGLKIQKLQEQIKALKTQIAQPLSLEDRLAKAFRIGNPRQDLNSQLIAKEHEVIVLQRLAQPLLRSEIVLCRVQIKTAEENAKVASQAANSLRAQKKDLESEQKQIPKKIAQIQFELTGLGAAGVAVTVPLSAPASKVARGEVPYGHPTVKSGGLSEGSLSSLEHQAPKSSPSIPH